MWLRSALIRVTWVWAWRSGLGTLASPSGLVGSAGSGYTIGVRSLGCGVSEGLVLEGEAVLGPGVGPPDDGPSAFVVFVGDVG